MSIDLTEFTHKYKFWFYFRKGIFQVILPLFLAFLSLIDFMNQANNKSHSHLYFYTSFILLLYTGFKYVIQYAFDLCAETVIFKKEIIFDDTTSKSMIPSNSNFHYDIPVIRKIFKLQYSKNKYFNYLSQICWFLGLDCPILIPHYLVNRIIGSTSISEENEETILYTTLNYLQTYQPQIYEVTPLTTNYKLVNITNELIIPNHVITKSDKNICDIQYELFGKKNNLNMPCTLERSC